VVGHHHNHYNYNVQFLGKRVLELGCGPGLCSVVAGLTGASDVIATDGDVKSVELAATNICGNTLSSSTQALKLLWGDRDDLSALQSAWTDSESGDSDSDSDGRVTTTPDFIIASDVAGCPYVSAYVSLIDTLVALSGPDTVILMACQKRHDSENRFYDMLREKFHVNRYYNIYVFVI
jgi:ribosomal protein L11 methylase PrmA